MIYGTIGYDGKLIVRKLSEYLTGERYLALLTDDIKQILKSLYILKIGL